MSHTGMYPMPYTDNTARNFDSSRSLIDNSRTKYVSDAYVNYKITNTIFHRDGEAVVAGRSSQPETSIVILENHD